MSYKNILEKEFQVGQSYHHNSIRNFAPGSFTSMLLSDHLFITYHYSTQVGSFPSHAPSAAQLIQLLMVLVRLSGGGVTLGVEVAEIRAGILTRTKGGHSRCFCFSNQMTLFSLKYHELSFPNRTRSTDQFQQKFDNSITKRLRPASDCTPVFSGGDVISNMKRKWEFETWEETGGWGFFVYHFEQLIFWQPIFSLSFC